MLTRRRDRLGNKVLDNYDLLVYDRLEVMSAKGGSKLKKKTVNYEYNG